MIPVSGRYAPLLLLLLALTLVPIAIHEYIGHHVDDCSDPAALLDAMGIEGTASAREKEEGRRGQRFQFTTGRIATPRKVRPPFRYQILRTFDPAYIYMQPTYNLGDRFEADRQTLEWLEVADRHLPITWQFNDRRGDTRVVGFVYVYRSRPRANPFRAQLASAFDQLLHGRTPLTLFLGSGLAPKGRPELAQEPIRKWLAASWAYYKEVCSD